MRSAPRAQTRDLAAGAEASTRRMNATSRGASMAARRRGDCIFTRLENKTDHGVRPNERSQPAASGRRLSAAGEQSG